MKIFDRISDWFKEKGQLVGESMKTRRDNFEIKQKYNQLLEEVENVSFKYTKLLELKSEQFDLYIKYQNQCVELSNEKKELKKQVSEAQETVNRLVQDNAELEKHVEKLERKIKRMEKKNEKKD